MSSLSENVGKWNLKPYFLLGNFFVSSGGWIALLGVMFSGLSSSMTMTSGDASPPEDCVKSTWSSFKILTRPC